MEAKTYEFTGAQNQLISTLAKRMKFVAIFFIVLGAIVAAGGLFTLSRGIEGIVTIFMGALYIIIGIWTIRAANSFKQIVDTEQSDISYLMNALNELKKLYTLQYVLMIIAIVFMGIAILGGIIKGLS
jgi:sulfite exporter TauE/SafE